jgi:hypothetical protein
VWKFSDKFNPLALYKRLTHELVPKNVKVEAATLEVATHEFQNDTVIMNYFEINFGHFISKGKLPPLNHANYYMLHA